MVSDFFKKVKYFKTEVKCKNMGAPYNFSSGGANKKKKELHAASAKS